MNELEQHIKELDRQIMEADEQRTQFAIKEHELSERRTALRVELAFRDGAFREHEWTVRMESPSIRFTSYRKRFKKLSDLLWGGWHSSVWLAKGVELIFNDSDVDITFDDPKLAVSFATEHGLKLDLRGVEESIQNMRNGLNAAESLLKEFKP